MRRRSSSPLATRLQHAVMLAMGIPAMACGSNAVPNPVEIGTDATLGDVSDGSSAGDATNDGDVTDAADSHARADAPPLWDAGCEPVRRPALGDECNDSYVLPCGLPKDFPVGIVEPIGCLVICPPPWAGVVFTCATALIDDLDAAALDTGDLSDGADAGEVGDAVALPEGGALLVCTHCASGRRPSGLEVSAPPKSSSEVGLLFARVAELEAASIDAFAILRRDLRAHGAPTSLVRRAARARRDEVRHARSMASLARLHGGRPRLPRIARRASERSLFDVARENLVEGCVRETFGAAVAAFQAERAASPKVRAHLRAIAADETAHAELSHDLARWLGRRVGARAQVYLTRLAAESVCELRAEIRRLNVAPSTLAASGLPTKDESLRILDVLFPA